jgi:hypothetical protein
VSSSRAAAFASLVALALVAGTAVADPGAPAPDPPFVQVPGGPTARSLPQASAGAALPDTEWTLHRTPDGLHPDGVEQGFVWLMNRARQDPTAEGVFLATVDDPSVQYAIAYFGVNVPLLESEFAALAPKPPAAFDVRLYQAAYAHSLDLIARDAQDHNGQFADVDAAGFHYGGGSGYSLRGNVFSYAESALQGHAAFNIDWAKVQDGMQAGRGHRMAIMSVDGDYTNVGIAAVPESEPTTAVGPLVVTGNYAHANEAYGDHYNRFLVGTVWTDLDGNGRYDPGEGRGGVYVVPDSGPYFAVTAAGGGYAIPLFAAGTVQVTFRGGRVPRRVLSVDVGTTSVLLDDQVVPEPAPAALAATAVAALAALARGRRSRRA